MKRTAAIIFIILAGSFMFSQENVNAENKITLTNIFGGNNDELAGSDFAVFTKKENESSFSNKQEFLISNRIQLDYKSEKINGKIRLDMFASKKDGETSLNSLDFKFKGFVGFSPVKQLTFAAGNSFFNKFILSGSYLCASDDYPSYGKMLKNGFGIWSNFDLGESINLRFSAGIDGDSDFSDSDEKNINLATEFCLKNYFSLGANIQNVTSDKLKYSVFTSFQKFKNFSFNAGYSYNNSDEDFLPEKTLHSLQLSIGYNFKNIGFYIYDDAIISLTDEYLKDGEKYFYEDNYHPFYTNFRMGYNFTQQLSSECSVKYTDVFNKEASSIIEIYPEVLWHSKNSQDTLCSGIRFIHDDSISDELLNKISISFYWKKKFNF